MSGEGRRGLCPQMQQCNFNQRGTKEHGICFKSPALTIFQTLYILVIVVIIIIISNAELCGGVCLLFFPIFLLLVLFFYSSCMLCSVNQDLNFRHYFIILIDYIFTNKLSPLSHLVFGA